MQVYGLSVKLNKLKELPTVVGKNGDQYVNLSMIVQDTPDKMGNDGKIIETVSKDKRDDMRIKEEYLDTLGFAKLLFSK